MPIEEAADVIDEQQEEVQVLLDEEGSAEETEKVDEHGTDLFDAHGGDPRELDLGRSLLVSNLPSSFLNDSFDVFSECVQELLVSELKITRDAIEKIVRIPKLQTNAENKENSLRAIVMFKSRVHKYRAIAHKKLTTMDGFLVVEQIEKIPAELFDAEDIEMDNDANAYNMEDNVQLDEEEEEDIQEEEVNDSSIEKKVESKKEEAKESDSSDSKKESKKVTNETKKDPKKEIKEAKKEEAHEEKKKEERPKKAYIDEDLKAPYEISWDGAPEFQWKICSQPGDARQLTIDNLCYPDLQNPFIYRVMIKADNVDISFPTRYNSQGNKQQFGRMVMAFQFASEVMQEAVRHLIYVRCTDGRRIKVYLPQTTQAMKQKDELEEKLGRVIKHTPRMHQIIIKILPKEEYTINDAKSWFPECSEHITNWEQLEDEIGQNVGVVTFDNAEAVVIAHSNHGFLNIATSTDRTAKVQVLMRGVEAHFGSLLTRWDQKKAREFYGETQKPAPKRSIGDSRSNFPAKRGRHINSAPRSRVTSRGAYSSRGRPSYPPSYGSRDSNPAPFVSSRDDTYGRRSESDRGWRVNQYASSTTRYGGSSSEALSRFSLPFGSYTSPRRDPYQGSNYGRR